MLSDIFAQFALAEWGIVLQEVINERAAAMQQFLAIVLRIAPQIRLLHSSDNIPGCVAQDQHVGRLARFHPAGQLDVQLGKTAVRQDQ